MESKSEVGDAEWAPAGPHLPKNLTDQASELILVEIKEQPQAAE